MAPEHSSRIGRAAAVLVVAAIVAMWLYVFSGAAAEDPPDQLSDPGFASVAEPLCAEAVSDLDALPSASVAEDAADRAEVLDEANRILEAMVDDLAAIDVAHDHDRELVDLWLADWRTYLEDRRQYAEDLRAGEDAELLVTARGGRQITLTIDRFASPVVNDMESCATPLDA